jgi:hypothetical protein
MKTRTQRNIGPRRAALPDGTSLASDDVHDRIIPGDPPHHDGDEESLDAWGFRDSAFTVRPNDQVVLAG